MHPCPFFPVLSNHIGHVLLYFRRLHESIGIRTIPSFDKNHSLTILKSTDSRIEDSLNKATGKRPWRLS